MEDPGQIKLLPGMQLSETLFAGFKGNGPLENRIQNVRLATNPCRISFFGKQIVISRFDYFKKLKENHLSKVQQVQEKLYQQANFEKKPDTYRVANSIIKQGFLLPLPQIVQPVAWQYAVDTLNLMPEPDFVILADECGDYYHQIPCALNDDVEDSRSVHVINPGSFSQDQSFVVIYPT